MKLVPCINTMIKPRLEYLYTKVKITRLEGTNMRNNDESTLINSKLNLFRNAEYILNGKCVESFDCVGITTTIKNLLKFSDDYSHLTINLNN